MWFDKKSVRYKIPSHRIVDIQKQWNYVREGKRYANPSFLYGTATVCLFCSQFFWDIDVGFNVRITYFFSFIFKYILFRPRLTKGMNYFLPLRETLYFLAAMDYPDWVV
jgi:hypothetical protein